MTCSFSKDFSSNGITSIENNFIYEYLPLANGDSVRVYLYGLFLCQNPNYDQSLKDIASSLNLKEEEVVQYFEYWEEFGLVSIVNKDPISIQYLPVKSAYQHKPIKYKTEKYTEFTKSLQSMISTRMISTGEYTEYFNIMETYGIKQEAMLMIVKYCLDRKGQDVGYRYVSKVAKDFGDRGITTMEKVEKELSSYIARTGEIDKILKALSLKRQPEIEDLNYYKKWTQELSFETGNIVFAASKMKKGSMAKLDSFIMELYSIKSFDKEAIKEYLDKKQNVFDLSLKITKALSIYVEVIDTVIDTYVNRWLSYGLDDKALIFIAQHCFKEGKNSLKDMDNLIEELRVKGVISLSSISDFFSNEKEQDLFIEKMLQTAGINRHPTPWDRENISIWRGWNFSDEMILESAKLSAGKSSPIAYMNGILSNWKNNGVFNTADITESREVKDSSEQAYNLEYERRRTQSALVAQKNIERAMEIDGFSDIYSRLNGIEKDLAFAEINNNLDLQKSLEKEKLELNEKASKLLKKIGLTTKGLTQQYICEKCKDTGYIGTHRCDCYNKKTN